MKNIGSHIAQILSYSETAYLPGIGTFTPAHSSARFDNELNRFIPPALTVQFDPNPLEGDASGMDRFSDEITQLREHLEKQGNVTIDGIGTLTQEGSELRFVPLRDNFYAFTPLSERPDILEVSAPSIAPDSAEQPENVSTPPEEDLIEEETERKQTWLKWAAVLLIGGAAVYGYHWYSENAESIQSSNPSPEITSINTVADSMTKSEVADTSLTINTDSTDSTRRATSPIASDEGDFEIIIASFRKIDEAEAYVHTMKNKGYELRIIIPNRAGNLHKISYGAYPTKDEALVELRKVRKDLVAGAWLFEHSR